MTAVGIEIAFLVDTMRTYLHFYLNKNFIFLQNVTVFRCKIVD